MTRIIDPRPIEFRQVCAIARVALTQAPLMTDAEWKAAVLDTCAKQGWDSPEPGMLASALGAVERAMMQTVGPRRVRELVAPAKPAQPDRAWSMVDLKALAETVKRIQARSAGAAPSNVRTVPLERWEISEPAALDEFYRQAESDRMGALKRFAEIAVARPAEWDTADVRAHAEARSGPRSNWQGVCFSCRKPSRGLVSHHVIQIQHGGSNYLRNRVDVCEACHAEIHPWLPRPVQADASGWFCIGRFTRSAGELVDRAKRLAKTGGDK